MGVGWQMERVLEFGPYEGDEERGEHLSTTVAVHNTYPDLATTASVCSEVLRDDESIPFWYRNYDSQIAARACRNGYRCDFNRGGVSSSTRLSTRRHVASNQIRKKKKKKKKMHEQFPSHLWFHVALLCAVPTGPTVGRGREGGGCGRGGGERYRGGAGWESSQGGGRGRGGGTDWGRLWELSGDSKKEVKGVDVFISTMKSGCPALYRMLKFYMESLCSTPILGLYLSTLCCSPINQRSAIAVTTFCVLNCDAFEACIEDVRGRC